MEARGNMRKYEITIWDKMRGVRLAAKPTVSKTVTGSSSLSRPAQWE